MGDVMTRYFPLTFIRVFTKHLPCGSWSQLFSSINENTTFFKDYKNINSFIVA